MKKKYIILLTIIALLFSGKTNINAYTADADTDSESAPHNTNGCGDGETPEGCSYTTQNFKVRVSLMRKDKKGELKIVPGTRIIDFLPNEGGDTAGFITYETNTVSKDYKDYKRVYNNTYTRYYGSIVTNKNSTTTNIDLCTDLQDIEGRPVGKDTNNNPIGNCQSQKIYYTYMGFNPEGRNDFENYKYNHDDFIRYITGTTPYNKYKNINTSFIDQFLYLSGFTDNLKASSDRGTLQKLFEEGYYLSIEPIYTIGIVKNKNWHALEATAKQLSAFLFYEHPDNQKQRMWLPYQPDVMFNHVCNFLENTSILEEEINDSLKYKGSMKKDFCDDYSKLEKISDQNYKKENYFKHVMHPTSPFGVNMVRVVQETRLSSEDLDCVYKYEACDNNDYIYSLKLYKYPNGNYEDRKSAPIDLSECVYTDLFSEENKVVANEMKNYFYNDYDSNNNQIWCYDNVEYDFSKLKELQNKKIKSLELIDLPAGVLTIDRTCYANKDVTEQLVNDAFPNTINNIENNNNISLTLNGKDYYFKLAENNTNDHKPNMYEESSDIYGGLISTSSPTINEKIYTKTYTYIYQIDNTKLENVTNINGNYYMNVGNNVLSTAGSARFDKSIISNYDASSIIEVPTQNNYIKEYDNTLIFEPKNVVNISNKRFGISSDAYSRIVLQGQKKIDKIIYGNASGRLTEHTINMTLTADSDEQNKCTFKTTVIDTDILGEGLRFRTISLSNPFPGRDGTSRLPGVNWLNEENYVYDYIINNRNVKGEEVYNKEPLYKITLTPQTMIEIRKLNKERAYDDFRYICEGETGQKCKSTFLTDLMNKDKLEGTCVYARSDNPKAIDTNFYSCADKTVASAGKCYYKYDSTINDYINSCTGKKLKNN